MTFVTRVIVPARLPRQTRLVALDGTKIKANASKHKAMSYDRMKKREAELKAEVARMLVAAEAADSEEDDTFGKDKRGDELPDWTGDKQKRLAKIQQAMTALEAEARQAAEEEGGSRPKRKSSAKPKAARSRASGRRRHQRNPIPRRNAVRVWYFVPRPLAHQTVDVYPFLRFKDARELLLLR